MKLDRIAATLAPSLLVLTLGCAQDPGAFDEPEAEPIAAEASAVALSIEQAERLLERGGDAAEAKALLQEALTDPQISDAERSLAALALSRAHQALGETEAAIVLIEKEMAAHANDRSWPDRDFRRQLRQLLIGSESATDASGESHGKTPAFARVLSRYFPVADDGRVVVMTHILGSPRGVSDDVGTFNVVGGIYAELEASCPLCDRQLSVSNGVWRGDWTDIPAAQQNFDTRMVIFYYDLGKNRVPARYQHHLPMSIEAIEAELSEGKSFVVAKERPGAPPVLLLAAPRTAMLADLERRLADYDALPTEPYFVDVRRNLRPAEIRGVVRGRWYPHIRACYESLLKRSPEAGGKVILDFSIDGEGAVQDAKVTTDDAPFEEETFSSCMVDSLEDLRFPASGLSGNTTVRYPVVMTPDDD